MCSSGGFDSLFSRHFHRCAWMASLVPARQKAHRIGEQHTVPAGCPLASELRTPAVVTTRRAHNKNPLSQPKSTPPPQYLLVG